MTYGFFALMFRMKYINRWALMRCTSNENLAEHSLETAILANALANIGNEFYGKQYDASQISLKALYHDATEIMTGDLPTPIKYYNTDIRKAYSDVEKCAEEKIVSLLPDSLKEQYKSIFTVNDDEKMLIKVADKLCAYIKCKNEVLGGNIEFEYAEATTLSALKEYDCTELNYFMENFLPAFFEPLDNISL